MSKLPSRFVDISIVRVVPDHQEVFVYTWSPDDDTISGVDVSIIIELLSMENTVSNNTPVGLHFNDLAASNEAMESTVYSEGLIDDNEFIPSLDGHAHEVFALTGRQRVSKYRTKPDSTVDNLYVFLVLVRLPEVTTDVLISMNIPIDMDDAFVQELNEQYLNFGILLDDSSTEPSNSSSQLVSKLLSESIATYRVFVKSLSIVDWGLFQ